MILASIFQNGAVLQRRMTFPVWGKCAPNADVEVRIADVSAYGRSSSDGDFMLCLPALEAGGPHELTVSAGGETVTLSDILVGELWLASGQSNMEYALGSDWRIKAASPDSVGREQEARFNEMVMDPERFRVFSVGKCASGAPEFRCAGQWRRMIPENSADVSAVAAWFGLGLQYQLDVPVGIIVSAWGGTVIEAWSSYEALWTQPGASGKVKDFLAQFSVKDRLDADRLFRPDPGNGGEALGYAGEDFDDSQWQPFSVGGSWIRQHLCGNGAVWLRKSVDLPESWAGAAVELVGGAVDKHDISYFNGREIGRTGKGVESDCFNQPRRYRIPGELVKAGRNVIAIRGFSFAYDGAITGCWALVRSSDGARIELSGDDWRGKAEFDWGIILPEQSAAAMGPGNANTPTILFDGMILPLIPFAMRGVIWYQGENNASSVESARAYRDQLVSMIGDWRRKWRMPEMPFLIVQLAGYGKKEPFFEKAPWAELRESQRLAAGDHPANRMITAVDIGNEEDIHPENKMEVGKRLAMCALHHVYGYEEIVPSGPEAVACECSGGAVRIRFRYAAGLSLKSEEPAFFLAGRDGTYHPADKVEVDGESVLLSASSVSEPIRVCYAWADDPFPSLYNGDGFPAAPFRLEVPTL